jgi:hypothetical protein
MRNHVEARVLSVTGAETCNPSVTVEIDGVEYTLALPAVLAIGIVPPCLPCVVVTLPDGGVLVHISRRYLLERAYGKEGRALFKVLSMVPVPESNAIDCLVQESAYNFTYRLLAGKAHCKFMVGDEVELDYKLYPDDYCESVMELSPIYGHVDVEFVTPDMLCASCGNAVLELTVRKCLARPDTPDKYNMKRQVSGRNNLWMFSLANIIKESLDGARVAKDCNSLVELCAAYLTLEMFIRTNDSVLSVFPVANRIDLLHKNSREIRNCGETSVAIWLMSCDDFGKYLEEQILLVTEEKSSEVCFAAIATVMNYRPDYYELYGREFARFTVYANAVNQDSAIVSALREELNCHVARLMKVYNEQIHVLQELPHKNGIRNLCWLLSMQIVLYSNLADREKRQIKYVQLCRYAGYLLSRDRTNPQSIELAKETLTRGAELLYKEIDCDLTLLDVPDNTHLVPLIEKICHATLREYGHDRVYCDNGIVIFGRDGIRVYPPALLEPEKDLSDCRVLYNMLYGRIKLCSQVYKGLNGLNDKNIETAVNGWSLIYMKRRDSSTSARSLVRKDCIITYTGTTQLERNVFMFDYTDKNTGKQYGCLLSVEEMFNVPGCTADGLLEKSDTIPALTITRASELTFQVSIKDLVQRDIQKGVEPGDAFTVQALRTYSGDRLLYGVNGAVCRTDCPGNVEERKFYTVRVLSVSPDATLPVEVEIICPSPYTFDAVAVNERVVAEYIKGHRGKPYDMCTRNLIMELVYMVDTMSYLPQSAQKRHINYQFAKLFASIERSSFSYMYDWLIKIMKTKNRDQKSNIPTTDAVRRFPRIGKAWNRYLATQEKI